MSRLSKDRRGLIGAIIVIVIVVIIVIALLALIFIPFRETGINESRQAALGAGVDTLNFTFSTNMGSVEVRFVDDAATAVAMTVTGSQRSGLLGGGQPVNVSWSESTEGSALTVTSSLKLSGNSGPFSSNNLNCTVLIASQLRTALTLTNDLGSVEVQAGSGIELTSVNIRTSTGGSRLIMAANSTLNGPLKMEASLGGVDLQWTDVRATENASIDLRASTGGVLAKIFQSEPLGGNVTVNASSNLGGVDLTLAIQGNNSAHVLSHANLGGVNVAEQVGFNGTSAELTSQNYPGTSNFEVNCDANTGGVNLRLRYAAA
jgi:hypothetical protein